MRIYTFILFTLRSDTIEHTNDINLLATKHHFIILIKMTMITIQIMIIITMISFLYFIHRFVHVYIYISLFVLIYREHNIIYLLVYSHT